jgi:hypothetical protein
VVERIRQGLGRGRQTMDKELYRVREVGPLIGYQKTKVYEFIKDGRLKAVELDGIMLVTAGAIEKFVQRRVEASKEESLLRAGRRERAQAAGRAAARSSRAGRQVQQRVEGR